MSIFSPNIGLLDEKRLSGDVGQRLWVVGVELGQFQLGMDLAYFSP